MNLSSPSCEFTVIINLCGGVKEIQEYFMGHLKYDFFGVPIIKDIYKRVMYLVTTHNKPIPTIQDLKTDLSLSEESRKLFKNYKKFERIKTVSRAKLIIERLNQYRKVRLVYDCSQKTIEIMQKDKVNVDTVLGYYENVLEKSRTSMDMSDELLHIGKGGNASAIIRKILDGEAMTFIPTGFEQFDKINGGFGLGSLVSIAASTSGGKAQPLHCKIKIPNGWVTMGDVKLGQEVCTPDGGTAKVTGLFPQGIKDVYKITMLDGRATKCCKEHLWDVKTRFNKDSRTVSLGELIIWRKKHPNSDIFTVPVKKALYSKRVNLFIDPYIMGCLLGDGNLRGSVGLTNNDNDLLEIFRNRLIKGYILKKVKSTKMSYRVIREKNIGKNSKKGEYLNYYTRNIYNLGLLNKRAWEKHIPKEYLESSVEQRLELLKGLIDTDGYVGKGSRVSFSTTSNQLALDFQYLVRSLGGLCSIKPKITYYKYKGKRKKGRLSYNCFVTIGIVDLSNITRKKDRLQQKKSYKNNYIKSIEYVGKEECQCIVIDNPKHLYITDDFIVTHNSAMAVQLLINMYRSGYDVGLVSLEMKHEEILARILANISRVDCLQILRGDFSEKEKIRMEKAWIEFNELGVKNGNNYDIYNPKSEVDIKDVCYRLAAFNYSVMIVDYISLLKSASGKYDEMWKALGETARFLKRFAESKNMVGVLLCQLSEEHKIRYARAIKEHSDLVWSWFYNKEIAEETNHVITIDIPKARNQMTFSFKVDERFKYMLLEDSEDYRHEQNSVLGVPNGELDELNLNDDLDEY